MKKIALFVSLCFIVFSCGQNQNQGETILVDKDVEIPIKACVETYSKVFGNSVDPVALCKCLLPKFYEDLKHDPNKLKLLKEGKWTDFSQEQIESISLYFQDCLTHSATIDSTASLTITPGMAEGIKQKIKQSLIGTDVERTNDIDKYCNCVISNLQNNFTAKEIMQTHFNETEKYSLMLNKCLKSTKKE